MSESKEFDTKTMLVFLLIIMAGVILGGLIGRAYEEKQSKRRKIDFIRHRIEHRQPNDCVEKQGRIRIGPMLKID